MATAPKKTDEPRLSYTFDAIPEDEATQDELNRRMRKPGEPGYSTAAKPSAVSQPKADHASADQRAESKDA